MSSVNIQVSLNLHSPKKLSAYDRFWGNKPILITTFFPTKLIALTSMNNKQNSMIKNMLMSPLRASM
jgi:hypothetical protein